MICPAGKSAPRVLITSPVSSSATFTADAKTITPIPTSRSSAPAAPAEPLPAAFWEKLRTANAAMPANNSRPPMSSAVMGKPPG